MSRRLIRYLDTDGTYKYASVKDIGALESLKTKSKTDVVTAINEIVSTGELDLGNIREDISSIETGINGKIEEILQGNANRDEIQQGLILKEKELREKQQEIIQNIVKKADLDYVDGKFVDKVDKVEYENRYNEIKDDLLDKVNLDKYNLEREEVLGQLLKKADSIDVTNLTGRVTKTEKDIKSNEDEISQRLTKLEYDDAVGVDRWIASKFDYYGTDFESIYPTFSMIQGKKAVDTKEFDDSMTFNAFTGTDYIAHYFTNVHVNVAKTISLKVTHTQGSAVYMNGAMIYQSSTGTSNLVSLSLRQGWNTVEILQGATTTSSVKLNLAINTLVDKLTAHIGIGDKNDTRFSQAETAIIQTNKDIELKADKTTVESLGNIVSNNSASIKVMDNEIKSKVSSTEFNNYSKIVTDSASDITQLKDAIIQKVNRTEHDTLNNTVTSQGTEISQLNKEIALKVNSDVVDGIKDRVEKNETAIQLTDKEVALKANSTDLENVTGRLGKAEAELIVQSDRISSKVSQEEFDNLEIGGRNWIRKKNHAISDQYQIITDTGKTSEYDTPIWKSVRVGAGTPPIHLGQYIKGADGYYTASIYVKVEDWDKVNHPSSRLRLLIYDTTNRSVVESTNIENPFDGWVRLTVTAYLDDLDSRIIALYLYTPNAIDAVTYFHSEKLEKGTLATDYTEAYEDTSHLIQKAQETADKAESDAETANSELADISSDSKLTPVEKQQVKKEWDIIASEKNNIVSQATKYEISSTLYVQSYNALETYLNPLLINMNTTSDIVGISFRDAFKVYYTAKTSILKQISDKAKDLTDKAQSDVDGLDSRVIKAESEIVQHRDLIEQTVKKTEYQHDKDTMNSRVTKAETSIKQHDDKIAQTVTKIEYNADKDGIVGRLTDAETKIIQHSDMIEQTVTKTEFGDLLSDMSNLINNNPTETGKTSGWTRSLTGNNTLSVTKQDFFGNNINALTSTSLTDNVQVYSPWFNVDTTKSYEVSLWIKAERPSTNTTHFYVGLTTFDSNSSLLAVESINSSTGIATDDRNFYFFNTSSSTMLDNWTRITGYILPMGFSNEKSKGLGENVSRNARMKSSHTRMRVRFLNWGNTNSTADRTVWVVNPTVREVPSEMLGITNSRLTTAESSITQTAESIKTKAEKTELENYVDKKSYNTKVGELEISINGINGKVESTSADLKNFKSGDYATFKKQYGDLKLTVDEFTTKVGDLSGIDGTLAGSLSKVEQKSNSIESSVSSLKNSFDNMEISEVNLILDSDKDVPETTSYHITHYNMAMDWVAGEEWTVVIKGTVSEGQRFGIWANGSSSNQVYVKNLGNGYHRATFTVKKPTISGTNAGEKVMNVYNYPSPGGSDLPAKIEWVKLVRANRTSLGWTQAPEDTNDKLSEYETRISNAEEIITSDAIINTVTESTTFANIMDEKAGTADLEDLASRDELEQMADEVKSYADDAVNGIDMSPYVQTTELTQTKEEFEFKLSKANGVNMVRNSIGFADLDFWGYVYADKSTMTINNAELEVLGFGSGFYLPDIGGNKGIYQDVNVTIGEPFTLSWHLNKLTADALGSSAYRVYIQIQEDGVTKYTHPDNSKDITDGYEYHSVTYTPQTDQVRIRFIAYSKAEAIVTGIMMNAGEIPLAWTMAHGEVHNANVRVDMSGIKVLNSEYDGYTQITPKEFAGYADVDGSMERVFTLNKDVTEMSKAKIENEITMSPVKVVPLSGQYSGWAFVKETE